MLTILRNAAGQLDAACDWYLVNDQGQLIFDGSPTARHVWVEQMELSAGVSGVRVIRQVIRKIAEAVPYATDAYWYRKDRTGLQTHQFSRQRLVKEVTV